MDVQSFKCPNCGANLKYQSYESIIQCSYCESSVVVPNFLRPDAGGESGESGQTMDIQDIDNTGDLERLAEIARLIGEGNKIDAIKLYRRFTGLGLKDAKDAVEKISRGESVIIRHSYVTSSQPQISNWEIGQDAGEGAADLKAIYELILAGKKMDAIKKYRRVYGVDLKDARLAVEKISAQIGKKPAKTGLSCLAGLIWILILAFIPLFFISKVVPNNPISFYLSRINPFTSYARVVNTFELQGIEEGNWASLIASATNGNIYVLDREGQVRVLDTGGDVISTWSLEEDVVPAGLAVDTEGFVYIVHSAKIFLYDSITGESMGEYSYQGEWGFEDVVTDLNGGLVTVLDGDIIRFNSRGDLVLTIPQAVESVTDDSELTTLVAADRENNIYALGVFNDTAFKFDAEGNLVTQYGGRGDAQGKFRGLTASAIAVDSRGRVYVAAHWGIEVFAPDGTSLARIKVNGV
ncbi:MAG: ribosomal protein L7/L12, partial [Anaerolineae bacterium]|nr:ribosomal protein L7/L12 [Anaerolineae bacterium]